MPMSFLHRNKKKTILKFIMELQKAKIVEAIKQNNDKTEGITMPDFKP
jgi:hypothetical protein